MLAILIFILNIAAALTAVILVDRHVSRSTGRNSSRDLANLHGIAARDEDTRSVEFAEFGPVHKSVDNS